VLRVEQLTFAHGDLGVLWGVDLEVGAGEIVSVLGGNGAGKSTLLRCLSRLLRPSAGRIEFEGADLLRLAPHQVVGMGVVHVPEGRRIFPELTVLENLKVGAHLRAARRDLGRNLDRALTLFPRLAERRQQLGGTLSGGEQQMLAIARGLMGNPKLLLLDEPSLGLAPLLARSIFEIVADINRQGTTVLLVEQNVHQSLRISHRAYLLETGRVAREGPAADLLADAHVRQAYLGIRP